MMLSGVGGGEAFLLPVKSRSNCLRKGQPKTSQHHSVCICSISQKALFSQIRFDLNSPYETFGGRWLPFTTVKQVKSNVLVPVFRNERVQLGNRAENRMESFLIRSTELSFFDLPRKKYTRILGADFKIRNPETYPLTHINFYFCPASTRRLRLRT